MKKLFPFCHNGRYFNTNCEKSESLFYDTIPLLIKTILGRHSCVGNGRYGWIQVCTLTQTSIQPKITWIGHSTFLIQADGINIITDPIFGNLSLFHRRLLPPAVAIGQLPPIDCILISHNHPDHMDEKSLQHILRINPQVRVCVPQANASWFKKRGFINVYERSWWEDIQLRLDTDKKCEIIFLPAYHWSQRGLFDRNKTLWGSWLIKFKNHSIYFAGDTAYWQHFDQIGQEFPGIDVALMPIGPCEPRTLMRSTHVNPQEAIQGFLELQAKDFVPMHWGTFLLGTDAYDTAINELFEQWQLHKSQMSASQKLRVLRIGQHFELFEEQKQFAEPIVQQTVDF